MTTAQLLVAAVGCGALFAGILLALWPSSGSGLARLGHTARAGVPSAGESEQRAAVETLRAQLQASVGSRLDRSKPGARLSERLAGADLSLRPIEWLLMAAAVAAVLAGLLALRFHTPIVAPIGLLLSFALSEFVLRLRYGRRRKSFDRQLAPTILSISSGLKAGHTFGQAVDLVSRTAEAPMGPELARITREAQLGVPIVEALGRMVRRNDSDDLKLMLTAVQIHLQVGGNLAQVLDTIEFTIRERIRIKGEIKTITSQARVSGYVLIVLPFGLGGILSVIAPSYFLPMLHQTLGLIMLGSSGLFLLCGYGIIRRIVNIKV